MKIELENGKYTLVMHPNGALEALRNGEKWRDLTGDKFVYCLGARIEALEEQLAEAHNKAVDACIDIVGRKTGCRGVRDPNWVRDRIVQDGEYMVEKMLQLKVEKS